MGLVLYSSMDIMTCIHNYNCIQNTSTYSSLPSVTPNPRQPLIFIPSIDLPFPECYIVRIIQNVAFLDWHFWLCKMHFRFFNVFMWLCSSFIFLYLLRFIFPCICKHIYKSLNRIRLQTVDVNIVTFGWWFKSEFFSN